MIDDIRDHPKFRAPKLVDIVPGDGPDLGPLVDEGPATDGEVDVTLLPAGVAVPLSGEAVMDRCNLFIELITNMFEGFVRRYGVQHAINSLGTVMLTVAINSGVTGEHFRAMTKTLAQIYDEMLEQAGNDAPPPSA